MNIAFDFDGVITANWQHYWQLAYDFARNNNNIYILTAAKSDRIQKVENQLDDMNFQYSEIISRPINFISTVKNIGEWKKKMVEEYEIDLWFDNEIKNYELEGVDFSNLKTTIIKI